ncbi:MAG TPA: hypothetical protein DEG09_04460 [Marinilabiliaceae bacterium]|nr:hypothetical protein [Marinilabiliaceae bacterium]HBX87854.1 hypothetical protein [Marinilabiliaceae bacterium]
MRRLLFLITVFFLVSSAGFARSIKIADSCLHVLNTKQGLSYPERCELLLSTIHNLDYNDSFISLCNLLIKEAAKCDSYYHLFYGYYEKGQYLILSEGKTQEGLALIFKSLDIAKANLLTLEEGLAYYRISGEFSRLKNYPKALDYLNQATDAFSEVGSPIYLALAKLELANIHYDLKDYEKALVLYKEAEQFYASSNNHPTLAYIYGNIGSIQSLKHSPDSARQNLLHAISILEETKDPQSTITYHLELSQNELLCSDYNLALVYAQKAYQTAEAFNNPQRKRDAFEQLAKVYEAMGDYQQAYDYQNKYLHLRDSLLNTETITQIANMRADFEIGQKQQEVERIAASKRKITLITLITLLSLIVVAFLLVRVYRDARSKKALNKELLLKQEALSNSKKELERAISSKDRLFSIIAHDLRSPMATLTALSQILSQLLSKGEIKEAEELNRSIFDTLGQIDFMLDNLLNWSINQQDIYHPLISQFDLPELSSKILKAYFQTALAKDITLTFESDTASLLVESDSNCWSVIIRNLVNNALKFTHPGGWVKVSLKAAEDSAVLEVMDNGIGMTPQRLDKLFSKFESKSSWGTRNEKGQGLGLSLIHEFVTLSKGQIKVSSELNKGTKFTVSIPLRVLLSRKAGSPAKAAISQQI